MIKYPFLKKIIYSFYLKDVYKSVGKIEENSNGFKYLILLICLFWIPSIIKMQVGINSFLAKDLPVYAAKLPNIVIKDGTASFDTASPYTMKDENGTAVAIFDASGEITSLENTEAQVLVTDSKIIFKKDKVENREYSFSSIKDFTLTHEKIYSWAGWGNYLFILLYIFVIPFAFIYRAFQALIYTLIGLIFQSILKTKYSFQTIYRLSIFALTPAYIIDKIFGYFDFDFTGWSFACLVLSLSYLYFAMNVNKEADKLEEEIKEAEAAEKLT